MDDFTKSCDTGKISHKDTETGDVNEVDNEPNRLPFKDCFDYYNDLLDDDSEYQPDFNIETEHHEMTNMGAPKLSDDECDIEELIGSENDTSDDEYHGARAGLVQWNQQRVHVLEKVVQEGSGDSREQEHGAGNERLELPCSDYEDSEGEMQTDLENEGDTPSNGGDNIPMINKHTNFKTFKWHLGMRFPNRDAFKDAVTRYGVVQGYHLKISASDKNRNGRIGVRCEVGCPFTLYASWESNRACFLLKTLQHDHDCHRDMRKNKCFKARWAATQLLDIFKEKPHWPAIDIVNAVRTKFGIIIEKGVAYKIKHFAHRKLHGSMLEHYSKIGNYLEALRQASTNCDIALITYPDPYIQCNPPIFQRLYFCFDALREGFLEGCRRVLCLDGCFLKTFLGGMLLTAIGRDGNNQMYPVAWGVVEGETNDSWEWFMGNLKASLKVTTGEGWMFMSDQQKGLLNAVAKLFPEAEHRNCARHIYQHWKREFKGDELKIHFWNAVRAYCVADYNLALANMAIVSPDAVTAFKALNPTNFCRAFLKIDTMCDIVVNNMAETFNGWIINARAKHILYMLEDIRCQLMEWLCKKRNEMQKWKIICPRIQEVLESEKDEARNCFPQPSSLFVFQVSHKLDTLAVDMEKRTCTCRKWDLTGIPCCHAVSCAFYLRRKAEEYVGDYFKKENMQRVTAALSLHVSGRDIGLVKLLHYNLLLLRWV